MEQLSSHVGIESTKTEFHKSLSTKQLERLQGVSQEKCDALAYVNSVLLMLNMQPNIEVYCYKQYDTYNFSTSERS